MSAGAPEHLVQIVTGYAEAGNALVTSGINKLIFVGSTEIGKKVMQAAAQNLTPVVLELGGKDAFIICDDANLAEVTCVPTFHMHAHVCTCIHLFVPSSIWALFRQSFVHVLICAFLLCCVFIFGAPNLSRPSHALQCRLLNRKALVHTVHWQKLHCITHFGCDTYRKVLQTDELNH